MPITQERMLTCINAGLSAFNALELAQQILKEQIIIINNNHDSRVNTHLKSMLESLEILLTPEALVNTAGPLSYFEAFHQLQMEARHFREFKSTNIRAKHYQQRKRKKHQINPPVLTNEPSITIEQSLSLYQQQENALIQNAKDKLRKMQKPYNKPQTEDETDFRNYQPEDFE